MGKSSKVFNCSEKTFVILVFSVELALGGVIALDALDIHVPILRQFVGFVFLTFIPGFIILKFLKLDKLNIAESFVYTIGLSLTFLMLIGYLINSFLVFTGNLYFSSVNLFFVLVAVVSFLCILYYLKERGNGCQSYYTSLRLPFFPANLILIITPLLSMLGAYVLNFYNSNILLFISLFLILIIFILALDGKLIQEDTYPLVIFVIAISILYQNSLSSTYLDGYDIHREYYFANLVKLSGFWDYNINNNLNSMLSIVMIAPLYSELCNMSLTWVFKIIYPFFFSVLPVGIYQVYQRQINNGKISLLSTFYFMFIFTYFTEMLALARQQVAELFFIILIMLLISNIELVKRRFLIILFSAALIVSHYGLSYLFLFSSVIGYIFMYYILKQKSAAYHFGSLLFFFVFAINWYITYSEGSNFETIVILFYNIYNTFMEELLSSSQSMSLVTNKPNSISNYILKVLYMISQFFILFGFFSAYLNRKKYQFSSEYFSLSFTFLVILIICLVTSWTGMSINRIYHITSILLSLFCVIGGISLLQLLRYFVRSYKEYVHQSLFIQKMKYIEPVIKPSRSNIKLISLFLIIFMLFNVGIPQQILKDDPISRSLNRDLIVNSQNIDLKYQFYSLHFLDQDIAGIRWLSEKRNPKAEIYGDSYSKNLIFCSYGMILDGKLLRNSEKIESNSYLYMRYPNVHYGRIMAPHLKIKWNFEETSYDLSEKNLIYSSQDNIIYMKRSTEICTIYS